MADKQNIKVVFDFCKQLSKSINDRVKNGEQILLQDYEPLTRSFDDVISFIKTYLITAEDALYGTILMSMDTAIKYKNRGFIDTKTNGTSFTMEFNPLFLCDMKITHVITKVVAEVLRIIYEHPSTYAQINGNKDTEEHNLLEKGSDASTHALMEKEIRLFRNGGAKSSLNIPDDFYTTSDVISETDIRVKEDESLEYYYNVLKKFKKKELKPPSPSGSHGPTGMGQGNPGMGQGNEDPNAPATPDNNGGDQVHDWEGNDSEKTSEQIKSLVGNAYNSLDSKSRGMVPASIVAQIQKLLAKPEITWKNILRKFVGSIPHPYRHTRRRLNRRQPERADLCGRLPKRKVRIVVCIDTSGSMSDSTIEYCMNEIFHIAKANETEITIIECDAQVGRVYVAKKPSDIKPDVTGRGGTCFTPAIEYINEHKFRDALMIYFTDGYGEYEIPRPRTYRNMWVVTESAKNLSVKQPYGEVKSLSMDGDYLKYIKNKRGW